MRRIGVRRGADHPNFGKRVNVAGRATHGHSIGEKATPEYHSWCAMRQRCEDPRASKYPRYGGRGIKVCPEWSESFEAFLRDVGPRPSPRHTIGRENNNGNYEPGNVRWETHEQQANNRSNNRLIEWNGKTQTMRQWAAEIGFSYHALQSRLDRGWPLDLAMDPSASRRPKPAPKVPKAPRVRQPKEPWTTRAPRETVSTRAERPCHLCGNAFDSNGPRNRFCSAKCRKTFTRQEWFRRPGNREHNNDRRRKHGGLGRRGTPHYERVAEALLVGPSDVSTIAQHCNMKARNLAAVLTRLVKDGAIRRVGRGIYERVS